MADGLSLLVVDDDERIRATLLDGLTLSGHRVAAAACGLDALRLLERVRFDVVLLDLKLPGMDGLTILRSLRERAVDVEVVVLTGHGDVGSAVSAMKLGARDYLQKPCSLAAIDRVVRQGRPSGGEIAPGPSAALPSLRETAELIGADRRMVALRETIERVAATDATVLITGESGTGKELVTRLIHALSPRASGPLVSVDCPSIPLLLFESELFGHERGAFTGAVRRKRGKVEDADGGTLFLDEVAELPLEVQAKLLRFLQERDVVPVGGNRPAHVDTRVIAATNTDLTLMVAAKTFRRDLFHRLAVVQIEMPPLRERTGDIPLLATAFAERAARQLGGAPKAIGATALELLLDHAWPGNVRELRNVIEEGCILERGPTLTPASFSSSTLARLTGSAPSTGRPLAELHRQSIVQVLAREGWNISRSARTLGIHRATLHRKILALGLARDTPRQ